MTVDTKTLQEQYDEQLKAFVENGSDDKYDSFTPFGANVLVKLFKFVPDDPEGKLGKQQILVEDPLNRGNLKPAVVALNTKIYPFAKVIRKGTGSWGQSSVQSEDVEVGGVYVVPRNDVEGVKPNPDFLHAMNTYKGKTGGQGALVKITDEMNIPQNLPAIDVNWARHKFSMPDRVGDETEEEALIYLIPAQKLIAKYEYIK